MSDATPAKAGTKLVSDTAGAATLRQCAVTREERPTAELIRFVADPGGQVVPDLASKLPGRGVSVTATSALVAEAVRRNVFAKSLKRAARADQGLPALIDRLMADRLRQAVSFAQKAGLVVAGFAKVEAAIEAGSLVALLQAGDAAADGTERLARKFRAVQEARGRTAPVVRILTIADLSLAIGRSNVVHAGLSAGGQSRIVLDEALRLLRYRSNDPGQTFSLDAAAAGSVGGEQITADLPALDTADHKASTDKA